MGATLARVAASLLSNEKVRKMVGWVAAACLSPLILVLILLCSIGSGAADHNNYAVHASFYGSAFSDDVPAEYRAYVEEMQVAFSLLDSSVASVNSMATDGDGLDSLWVKAVFFALCFGESAPSQRVANRFVDCFYKAETRTIIETVTTEDGPVELEVEYTVIIPLPMEEVYVALTVELGRPITDADQSNAAHIYEIIQGKE